MSIRPIAVASAILVTGFGALMTVSATLQMVKPGPSKSGDDDAAYLIGKLWGTLVPLAAGVLTLAALRKPLPVRSPGWWVGRITNLLVAGIGAVLCTSAALAGGAGKLRAMSIGLALGGVLIAAGVVNIRAAFAEPPTPSEPPPVPRLEGEEIVRPGTDGITRERATAGDEGPRSP